MIKKLKRLVVISFILIYFCIQIPVFARYYEYLENMKGTATIAEPIIKVENLQDTIITDFNKNTEAKEYYFIVKNYETDSSNNKRITEVDFLYDIEIKCSDESFPIKYELYDCNTGEELLKNRSQTDKFEISKNIQYETKYKLLVTWNSNDNMEATNDIDIIVNVSQKK